MPDPTLSDALAEAYASAASDEIIYHTLEIYHPSFTVPIRVVRDAVDLTATLETSAPRNSSQSVEFTAFSFDVVPPEVMATGMPTCTIEIDNVSREILAQVEAAMSSSELISVIYRQFLSGSLASGPENDPPLTLTVLAISADTYKISATCGFADLVNKKFPRAVYSAEQFPGLIAS